MNIPMNARVDCVDGEVGTSTYVVFNPQTLQVTHLVVQDRGFLETSERMVPVEKISQTSADQIQLACTKAEFNQMPSFIHRRYIEAELPYYDYGYADPTLMSGLDQYVYIDEQQLPEGEMAIDRGTPVEATDGYIGMVGELLLDPATGNITHLTLMKGHLWGKREIVVPVTAVEKVQDETVYLKLDRQAVADLPAIPVKRAYKEVSVNDLELMVWIFPDTGLAGQALDSLRSLQEHSQFEMLRAVVMVKSASGNVTQHAVQPSGQPRGGLYGALIGGLTGLIVGPVGSVVGAIAGGVAGKEAIRRSERIFSKEQVDEFKDALRPETSALALLIEHRWFYSAREAVAGLGGRLMHKLLSDANIQEFVDFGLEEN